MRWPVPNVRGPLPCDVRYNSCHDLEIQGRFPASWDAGHVDFMVGREALEKKVFSSNILHNF